ncbi:hypothetical protein S40288_09861 [Stachybotrys chartarum IBT 40288]|nr:hypothetical protein S40288_09861 [Stachybotrys chartarum IBT 40288]
MQDSPLLSRAWVYQQRVLSPRVLHFCLHEMIWECGQDIAWECSGLSNVHDLKTQFALPAQLNAEDPGRESDSVARESAVRRNSSPANERAASQWRPDFDGFDERVDAQHEVLRRLSEIDRRRLNSGISKVLELIRQWHRIIEHYSQLSLTKSADRLPALSGLAHSSKYIVQSTTDSFR